MRRQSLHEPVGVTDDTLLLLAVWLADVSAETALAVTGEEALGAPEGTLSESTRSAIRGLPQGRCI